MTSFKKNYFPIFEILRRIGLDEGDIRIVSELYRNQSAEVKIEMRTSESIEG